MEGAEWVAPIEIKCRRRSPKCMWRLHIRLIVLERRGSSVRRADREVMWSTRIWDASGRNGASKMANIAAARVIVAAAFGAVGGGAV